MDVRVRARVVISFKILGSVCLLQNVQFTALMIYIYDIDNVIRNSWYLPAPAFFLPATTTAAEVFLVLFLCHKNIFVSFCCRPTVVVFILLPEKAALLQIARFEVVCRKGRDNHETMLDHQNHDKNVRCEYKYKYMN